MTPFWPRVPGGGGAGVGETNTAKITVIVDGILALLEPL